MDVRLTLLKEFQMEKKSIDNLIRFFEEDKTIPFIARYRKDQTEGADEVLIQQFFKRLKELQGLKKAIDKGRERLSKLGLLTEDMEEILESCTTVSEVTEFLSPYSKDKKTKAGVARDAGFQDAADIILGKKSGKLKRELSKLGDNDGLQKALDIVAEESVNHPKAKYVTVSELLISKIKVKLSAEVSKYENYVNVESKLDHLLPHQIHALFRGEKEGLLKFSIDYRPERIKHSLLKLRLHTPPSKYRSHYEQGLELGMKRLLLPRAVRSVRRMLKEKADKRSLAVFEENLMNLLLTPPISPETLLSIDPGFRSGCKIAVVDPNGNLLETSVIHPNPPNARISESKKTLKGLIKKYEVEFIVIGDGTASVETSAFVQKYFPEVKLSVVSEVGASVYSASKLARDEFPDLSIEMRSAVSIARRVLDPLAEYVKIDPRSLGVGQYQHDIDPKLLEEKLEFTVSRAINKYGISINTASETALTYVSGVGKALARRIVDYRKKNGLKNRKQLLKISGMGKVKFQQCSGFLRFPNSNNLLDNTMIHPDDYSIAETLIKDAGFDIGDFAGLSKSLRSKKLKKIDLKKYVSGELGIQRLNDIVDELIHIGIDRRGVRKFQSIIGQITSFDEVKENMELFGKVSNVTDFGAFIYLGIKENGLIHKSNLSNRYIPNVYSIIKVGDFVKTKVLEIDTKRRRLSLKLLEVNGKAP